MGVAVAHLHVTPSQFWDDYSFCPYYTALDALNPDASSNSINTHEPLTNDELERLDIAEAKWKKKEGIE